ncbi:TPA: hypothetical protein ACPVZG_004120 [Vibrio parahaemolyticus]|uniref:hypothetical protein n=1 Tax=Vibrio parahaemolyticus TaxID=670 RepID=UPI001DBC5C34|nr:hypothetical protein [Vibrio parahaemolyticus]
MKNIINPADFVSNRQLAANVAIASVFDLESDDNPELKSLSTLAAYESIIEAQSLSISVNGNVVNLIPSHDIGEGTEDALSLLSVVFTEALKALEAKDLFILPHQGGNHG